MNKIRTKIGANNKKRPNLNEQLNDAINIYNYEYDVMNGEGINLYHQRDKSIDLIAHIECLINSISHHPKKFDTELIEINQIKKEFMSVNQFVEKELEIASKQALGAGVGVATGAGVVAVTPTVALWVASTFGTASTGTAISTLSGAAATNAALAWLGGGALTSGGLGIAGGKALLALAGPIGWGIAGASILASVVLFANNRLKSNKAKHEEIASVKKNTENVKELAASIRNLSEKTVLLKDQLSKLYETSLKYYNSNYKGLKRSDKARLGALVNNTKSLANLIGTTLDFTDSEE